MLTILEAFKVLWLVVVVLAGGNFAWTIYLALKDMVQQLETLRIEESKMGRWKFYPTVPTRVTSTILLSLVFSWVCILMIVGVSIREIIEVIWA